MKTFWPHRSNARGFLIENISSKSLEKSSSISSNKILNQLLDNDNCKSTNLDSKKLGFSNLYTKREHWANRDFSEYKAAF